MFFNVLSPSRQSSYPMLLHAVKGRLQGWTGRWRARMVFVDARWSVTEKLFMQIINGFTLILLSLQLVPLEMVGTMEWKHLWGRDQCEENSVFCTWRNHKRSLWVWLPCPVPCHETTMSYINVRMESSWTIFYDLGCFVPLVSNVNFFFNYSYFFIYNDTKYFNIMVPLAPCR